MKNKSIKTVGSGNKLTMLYEYAGKVGMLFNLARLYSVPYRTLYSRILVYGWSIKEAIEGLKEQKCKTCDQTFVAPHSRTLYCSKDCKAKAKTKARAKARAQPRFSGICPTCNQMFVTSQKHQCYCSKICGIWARRTPIGAEKICKKGGNLDVYVKMNYGNNNWKRKAVIIAEGQLKRKLTQAEMSNLTFVDGNRLNCSVGNILVSPTHHLRSCKSCGNLKLMTLSQFFHSATGLCKSCLIKLGNNNRKLEKEQVACILSLKGISNRCICSWFCVSICGIRQIKYRKTWKEIEPMIKSQIWKTLLKQHDNLMRQGNATLYDRVTLLVEVHKDPHFMRAMEKEGKNYLEELDLRVSDTCANFTELVQIFKMFPEKQQWTAGNLNDMRMKMLAEIRNQKTTERRIVKEKSNERRSATLAETRKLKAENKRLRGELKSANQIIKSLEMQLETSRVTIGSLNETVSLFKLSGRKLSKKDLAKV